MEFGLYTFVDNTPDPETGQRLPPAQRMRNLMEEIQLADEAGLQVFGIGEHHREEYLASSPSTILAAAAGVTKQIRLTSAVTVLGSEDPVRVYQQYATLDLLSQGRAEIMVGRGSFIESFPLFGYDLHDYDELFAEKLGLLLTLAQRTPWAALTFAVRESVEFLRSTPLVLQIFFVFYVFPQFGVRLSPWTSGMIAIGLHKAAYLSEV